MPHADPVILIGTQRSGTTWMGDALARHPDMAYWEEPRHIWTWGSGYAPDDQLAAADATPRVAEHIRRKFERFVRERGGRRLLEKTPSNCLRIPFIRAVYPDARFILLVRDGRSVLRSTAEMLDRGVPVGRIWQRAIETPIWEWPAYAPRALGTIRRRLTKRPLEFWGPRPPGWREWVGVDPRPVLLARQWAGCINAALDAAESIPADRLLRVRYESIMERPRQEAERVVEFLGLADADELVTHIESTADATRMNKWRDELDDETLELVRPHMESTLRRLGYTW